VNRTQSGSPRPAALSGAARLAGAVVAAGVVATLVTGCDGGEQVRSPLDVEDLGPGAWAGPFEDLGQLETRIEANRCTNLGAFFPLGRDESLDEQEAFFGTD